VQKRGKKNENSARFAEKEKNFKIFQKIFQKGIYKIDFMW
jgi:hypothetical protein